MTGPASLNLSAVHADQAKYQLLRSFCHSDGASCQGLSVVTRSVCQDRCGLILGGAA